MNMRREEAWVTFGFNDDCFTDLIVLANSLRKSGTSREFILIVNSGMSKGIRVQLQKYFNGLFVMDFPTPIDYRSALTAAKMYCWSLTLFRRIVFIESTSIFLKNTDDIFKMDEDTTFCSTGTKLDSIGSEMLVLSPHQGIHCELLEKVGTSGVRFLEYLKEISANTLKGNIHTCVRSSDTISILNACASSVVTFTENVPELIRQYGDDYEILNSWTEAVTMTNNISSPINSQLFIASNEPLAIVGMSFRFPGANNADELWELMLSGRDVIRPVPNDRWRTDQSCFVDNENRKIKAGFLNCSVEGFDSEFFGMSPMELSHTDPQHRMLLQLSWEALEDAAIDPHTLYDSNASMFTGSWIFDYKDLMTESGFRGEDFYRGYMGNSSSAGSSRLAHFFCSTGPNISPESGCSTSTVALGMAMDALRKGTTNMALVGGANLLLRPFFFKNWQFVLSPDFQCKTFDASANGYVRAEGCAVIVVKRLSTALQDGDRIHALVKGYGMSQEGLSNSMGRPTVKGESQAMRMALEDAKVNPLDVSYIEAHGTGTSVGDPVEIQAISNVYGGKRKQPLLIASAKTNLGHTEACSGLAGIIKTILAFKNEVIPAHRNLVNLNPKIKLNEIPAIIPLQPVPWKCTEGRRRLAGVSSFGITGTDTHVILEEPPNSTLTSKQLIPQPCLLTISAKSDEALKNLLQSYTVALSNHDLRDVSYTANLGRAKLSYRAAVLGENNQEVLMKIKNGDFMKGQQISRNDKKICFLYAGLGVISHYYKMGKDLYNNSPVFRWHFDICEDMLFQKFKLSVKKDFWELNEELFDVQSPAAYPAIFIVQYCLTKLWESTGIRPDCVLGHSLGEVTAATVAGYMTLEEGLTRMVAIGRLAFQKSKEGSMIAVLGPDSEFQKVLKDFHAISQSNPSLWIDLAAINSSLQKTVGGTNESIQAFVDCCSKYEMKTLYLSTTRVFHSRLIDPVLPEYRKTVSCSVTGHHCDFISGVDGTKLLSTVLDEDYWERHLRFPVQFQKASEEAYREGCRVFIEIGAQPVLGNLVKSNIHAGEFSQLEPISVNFSMSLKTVEKEWSTFLQNVAELHTKQGLDIDWKRFYKCYTTKKISLPFYPFREDKYWFKIDSNGSNKTNKKNIIENEQIGKSVGLHPFLGNRFDAAGDTIDGSIFQGNVHLSRVPYISDHTVGNIIVFPGSGYIEMCFAAGENTYPNQILELKDVLISSPIAWKNLEDSTFFRMQTIIKSDSKIMIYSKPKGSAGLYSWTQNLRAKMLIDKQNEALSVFEKLSNLQTRIHEEMNSHAIYENLNSFGYNFGPIFRSLKSIRKNPLDDREILADIEVPSDISEYISHPVLLDGMLQASLVALLLNTKKLKSLQLPVSIKSFKWFKRGQGSHYFIHCLPPQKGEDENIETVTLFDDNGEILSTMKGLEFLSISVQQLESIIVKQEQDSFTSHELPLYEEKWELYEDKIEPQKEIPVANSLKNLTTDMFKMVMSSERECGKELDEKKVLDKAIGLGMLKALINIGMINLNNIKDQINIQNYISRNNASIGEFTNKMFARYFSYLIEDGFVSPVADGTDGIYNWNPSKAIPCLDALSREIESLGKQLSQGIFKIDWKLTLKCLESLPKILQHSITPLDVLFPRHEANQSNVFSAELFYHESGSFKHAHDTLERLVKYLIQRRISSAGHLRILEIGGGTGGATKRVVPLLEESQVPFTYTFTDISSSFFLKARKDLQSSCGKFEFKVLNIENDPMMQGFTPNTFDIVIAANVIHATINLSESSRHIRYLMKTQGLFLLLETLVPQRYLDVPFGLLEGYWRLGDPYLRTKSCVISERQWEELLEKVGFGTILSLKCGGAGDGLGIIVAEANTLDFSNHRLPKGPTWICLENDDEFHPVLKKHITQYGRNVVTVRQETVDKDWETFFKNIENIEGLIFMWGINAQMEERQELYKSYFLMLQSLLNRHEVTQFGKNENSLKLFLITRGLIPTGDLEPQVPTASTFFGMNRTLQNEYPHIIIRNIDLDSNDLNSCHRILTEIWNPEREQFIAFRNDNKILPRLDLWKEREQVQPPLILPEGGHYFLKLPKSKVIADLRFVPCDPPSTLRESDIEVKILAASLNFRDLLSVLKPTEQFEKLDAVCTDFSGKITRLGKNYIGKFKVGDSVLGNNRVLTRAMPSHIIIPDNEVIPLPSHLTFAEGATFPTALATAFHCLITVAKMSKSQTVLIHTGSGGVGLFAIQLAQHVEAKIITTAGSRIKRQYLRNLGVHHVFNSRDLSYKEKILEVTEGEGVDIVLNSLTGPGFKEASLETLKSHGYFIEMSKLNVWSPSEVLSMRPDVHYSVEDLSLPDTPRWLYIMQEIRKLIHESKIRPLPYTRFPCYCIREAFNFLKEARHIGKIVLLFPNEDDNDTRVKLLNDRSTYLVTGGFGGLGLSVVQWMVTQSARHLVLCGRSKPTEETVEIIKKLNTQGCNIHIMEADISDPKQCKMLINSSNGNNELNLPPLRGIFHSAGVLCDKRMEKMDWKDFELCLKPKVDGTWNLHNETKNLNLELFVCFSSVSALLGVPGQSNYAGANSFLDLFTKYRRGLGLAATSINWGPWSEVGMAKDRIIRGLMSFTNKQGLNALEKIIESHRPQVVVGDINPRYWTQTFPYTESYLKNISNMKKTASNYSTTSVNNAELISPSPVSQGSKVTSSAIGNTEDKSMLQQEEMTSDTFWRDMDSAEESTRLEVLENFVALTLGNLLQIESSKLKNENVDNLGLDSLMTIELRSHIQNLLGDRVSLSLNALADLNTLPLITNKLFKIIYPSLNPN